MQIALLCLDSVFDSALHNMRDVLATAARLDPDLVRVSLRTVSLTGDAVRTGSGQLFQPDCGIADVEPDLIVLPGVLAAHGVRTLAPMLETADAQRASSWLRDQHSRGAEIATACTGAWFVALAGLLDGHEATTTWHLAGDFQARFAKVHLQVGKMLTYDNRVRCAGAAMAHIDLALALVSAHWGGRICRDVAGLLLLDTRPSQAHYIVTRYLNSADDDFRTVHTWVRAHLHEPFSIVDLARECGMSHRTLARRIQAVTGEAPLRFVQRMRVEHALHLLETSTASLAEVTAKVGYAEPATLRRLIRAHTGHTPSQIRTHARRMLKMQRRA